MPSDVAAHLNGDKRADGGGARRGRPDHDPHPRRQRRGALGRGSPRRRPARHDLGRAATATPFADGAACASAPRSSEAPAEAPVPGRAALGSRRCSTRRRGPGARPRGFALRSTARVARESGDTTRFSSPNVRRVLPGTDPSRRRRICAADGPSRPYRRRALRARRRADADRINNGAMDNATGIATLIEVARQMSRPGNRPRRPILIAAVTAEEKGLLGAAISRAQPGRRRAA